jgi:predicted dehydrogenase
MSDRTTNGRSAPPVRTGVIGVGSMGRHHVRVYQELTETELVGVADADPEQAREIADRYGTRAIDRDELLDSVDAVSIAVPTRYHYGTATAAIDRGVHLLVEKPFVVDPADGRELVRRAREAGLTLQVGHVERFNPAVVELGNIIADLDVIAIRADRLGPPVDRQDDVSTALDLMIHDIDVVLSLVGSEIASIDAQGAVDNRYIDAMIDFEDGTIGTLTASRVTQERVRQLTVTATDCKLNLDYVGQSIEIHRHSLPEYIENNGDVRYRHESITERPTISNGEPLKEELRAFVGAVTDGTEPVVTGTDGLRALEVASRIDGIAADRRRESEVRP